MNTLQPSNPSRGAPPIPDFHILAFIGGGAYGEVWLAQSLTGTLRAVKVVWREDFEATATFEREFNGIREFEPLSRAHPGLVDVLHVGWNEEMGFYYCVMGLADDIETGQQIDPKKYRPRTLESDLNEQGRLSFSRSVEMTIQIADALHYLHSHSLAHRDIKPSNIIFVHGVPKLADIGLVAAAGDRGFVGTEGYVAPEGPGTPEADVFSLGKVLYEMSTGMDRQDFPCIPAEFTHEEIVAFRPLNHLICKACHPEVSRRYRSALSLAHDLTALNRPKRKKPVQNNLIRLVQVILLSLFTAAIWSASVDQPGPAFRWELPRMTAPSVTQDLPLIPLTPEIGNPWKNSLGMEFQPDGQEHVSRFPVEIDAIVQNTDRSFEGEVLEVQESNQKLRVVVVPPPDAMAFCTWLTRKEQKEGIIGEDLYYRTEPFRDFKSHEGPSMPAYDGQEYIAFRLRLVKQLFGTLTVTSTPSGANVYNEGKLVGKTPLTISKAPAGALKLDFELAGYERRSIDHVVVPSLEQNIHTTLQKGQTVVFRQPWQNSLGVPFKPVDQLMVSAWEVRWSDFLPFLHEKLPADHPLQKIKADPKHPVTMITRDEAVAYCEWLTERERKSGLINERHTYRLPTDLEWSGLIYYLPKEKGDTPLDRLGRSKGIYSWGYSPTPPNRVENLADKDARVSVNERLSEYEDPFPQIAPVASLQENPFGLYDIGGNVREWVSDDYGSPSPDSPPTGVLRGATWQSWHRDELQAAYRHPQDPSHRHPLAGFRIVLEESPDPSLPMIQDEEALQRIFELEMD